MLTKTIAMISLLSGLIGFAATSYAGEPEEWRVNQSVSYGSAAVVKYQGPVEVVKQLTLDGSWAANRTAQEFRLFMRLLETITPTSLTAIPAGLMTRLVVRIATRLMVGFHGLMVTFGLRWTPLDRSIAVTSNSTRRSPSTGRSSRPTARRTRRSA